MATKRMRQADSPASLLRLVFCPSRVLALPLNVPGRTFGDRKHPIRFIIIDEMFGDRIPLQWPLELFYNPAQQ
jgi:hypothetical protein